MTDLSAMHFGVRSLEAEKLVALGQITQLLFAERDLSALLDMVAREAARLLSAERASIFLVDARKGEVWSQVALGCEPIRLKADLGIVGTVLKTGTTLNVPDTSLDSRFCPAVDRRDQFQTRNILAAPMRNYQGEITGAFEVINKQDGSFQKQDEEFLKTLAGYAAIAIETAELMQALRRSRGQLAQENLELRHAISGARRNQVFLGTSDKIARILNLIQHVAPSAVEVLITGESGTGKELAARTLHAQSPRSRGPFVALNCAALPDNLVESELFGIEKGVATGVDRRVGKFEAANGGTLFLDEIGDLSLVSQAKILRVLQERVLERVGGNRSIPLDVRIISATNRNLAAEVQNGKFRSDLYYRLKVVELRMPALRELKSDIPLLANSFLARFCAELRVEPKILSAPAMDALLEYAWPGNVRELEHEMKRLAVSVPHAVIKDLDLSESLCPGTRTFSKNRSSPSKSLKEAESELEKRLIQQALEACRMNQTKTALRLGLSRQGLIKKMKRYGLCDAAPKTPKSLEQLASSGGK